MKQVYSFDELSIPMWAHTLFWLLYMLVFVYAFRKTVSPLLQKKQPSDVPKLFVLFFVLYTVFYGVVPDYFNYRDWVFEFGLYDFSKENFYPALIVFCLSLSFDYPYEVFRLVVWGGAVLLAYLTYSRYRKLLLPGLSLLFLFVLYGNTMSYSRASLGMAVYFFGVALLLTKKRFFARVLGIAVAVSSIFFHREMIIGILVLPAILVPFEKKNYSLLTPFLLLAAVFVIRYFNNNLAVFDEMFESDILSSKVEEFNEAEQGRFRLSTLIKYLNFAYPIYLITKCFWRKKMHRSVVGMYRVTYVIILVSVAFMIVFGLRSVFVYRVLYISCIPMSLLISYCYYKGYLKNRQLLLLLLFALLVNSTRFINVV